MNIQLLDSSLANSLPHERNAHRFTFSARSATLVSAWCLLAACATTERVIGSETQRRTDPRIWARTFDVYPLAIEIQKSSIETRDLTARIEVDQGASQMQPPIGSAPGTPTWVVLRLTLSSKASIVRDFDVVVALQGEGRLGRAPIARNNSIEEHLLELVALPTVAVRPGVSQVVAGNRLAPVRVWPGIDTTLFIKLLPSPSDANADVLGFVGLFDAQTAAGGPVSSARLEFKARTEVVHATYRASSEEDSQVTIDLVVTEKFGSPPSISRRERAGSTRTLAGKELVARDFRLVALKTAEDGKQQGEPPAAPARSTVLERGKGSPTGAASPVAGAAPMGPCARFGEGVLHVRIREEGCSTVRADGQVGAARARSVWSLVATDLASSMIQLAGSDGAIVKMGCECAEPL